MPDYHAWTHRPKLLGGTDPIEQGLALYEIKVFEDDVIVVVTSGETSFWWPIPADLDQAEIVYADAGVSTGSSGGSVELSIFHHSGGAGGSGTAILSTKIIIPAGQYNATPGVVTGGAYGPITGGGPDSDWLRIDVDAAGSGAKGLAVMVGVIAYPLGTAIVQGAQGPPGGAFSPQGGWATSTTYQAGDVVSNNGSSYVALSAHTAGASTEPGVGASWETVWMLLAGGEQLKTSAFEVIISGNGYALDPSTAPKAYMRVPFTCTIVEATLLADVSGSVVVDIWKDTYGNYPPTDADSITAAAPPTLSSAIKTTDTSLAGWTTSLSEGDVLAFVLDSVSSITRLTCALRVERI